MIHAAHILGTPNLGDQVCSPAYYVNLSLTERRVRFCDVSDYSTGDVVFGGGGLLHPANDHYLRSAAELTGCKRIVWGVGTNYHHTADAVFPDWLKQFDLVGLRDVNSGYDLVPCPSCLNPEFNHPRPVPALECAVYEHYENVIPLPQFPHFNNAQPWWRFNTALDFLSAADCVITNTYHGAYWASLLGRKVLVWKPFANRFHHTPFRVEFCDEMNWKQRLHGMTSPPSYLNEARRLNAAFLPKVREVLEIQSHKL